MDLTMDITILFQHKKNMDKIINELEKIFNGNFLYRPLNHYFSENIAESLNLNSKNNYLNIECESRFKKNKDGKIIYEESKDTLKIKMCSDCLNHKNPSNIDEYGGQTDPDYSNFFNCFCGNKNNNSLSRINNIFKDNYKKKYIIYKKIYYQCCEIDGGYLIGGNKSLKCINKQHINNHINSNEKLLIEEDKKYINDLLKMDFLIKEKKKHINIYIRKTRKQDRNYYAIDIKANVDWHLINALVFHYESKYIFVKNQDLFRLILDFIGYEEEIYFFNDNSIYKFNSKKFNDYSNAIINRHTEYLKYYLIK
jgi:hypothetical protein